MDRAGEAGLGKARERSHAGAFRARATMLQVCWAKRGVALYVNQALTSATTQWLAGQGSKVYTLAA